METMETPTPRCTPGHEYRCREAKSNKCHCNCGGAHHGIGMQFDWVRALSCGAPSLGNAERAAAEDFGTAAPGDSPEVDDGDYIAERVAERDDTPPTPYE